MKTTYGRKRFILTDGETPVMAEWSRSHHGGQEAKQTNKKQGGGSQGQDMAPSMCSQWPVSL